MEEPDVLSRAAFVAADLPIVAACGSHACTAFPRASQLLSFCLAVSCALAAPRDGGITRALLRALLEHPQRLEALRAVALSSCCCGVRCCTCARALSSLLLAAGVHELCDCWPPGATFHWVRLWLCRVPPVEPASRGTQRCIRLSPQQPFSRLCAVPPTSSFYHMSAHCSA